jgi:flagellar hook protein FlgE
MASEISTIQSLKAVDAWIDVINANINGGVRTAFKSSRLTFSGSNTDVSRAGTSTSLPLQFPEPGLTTANTVIDFSQGAITASTENAHLAIQGDGFFLLCAPNMIDTTTGASFGGGTAAQPNARFFLTRDGEFRTNQYGLLVNSQGYYLIFAAISVYGGRPVIEYDNANAPTYNNAVYNDLDNPNGIPPQGKCIRLSEFLKNPANTTNLSGNPYGGFCSTVTVVGGMQQLKYTSYGSTVFDFGYRFEAALTGTNSHDASISLLRANTDVILSKSLEASNASMTQSVPELSLAQKLFSALTKVLQTKQTNVDGVLNLVR